jgi:hypothetical protein
VIRFSILKFINESKKRCAPFILYLNFINASGKRCDQQEWNMFKIHFTIPKFLQVIEPYRIMSLVFWKWNSTVFFVFSILLQKSGKRCAPFFAYLNFNNKSRTESRFILLYLNFHKSLVFDTKTEMWSVCSMLKLYQQEWNRAKIHFTIPKFL